MDAFLKLTSLFALPLLVLNGCSSSKLVVISKERMQLSESWKEISLRENIKAAFPLNDLCVLIDGRYKIKYQEKELFVEGVGRVDLYMNAKTSDGKTFILDKYSSLGRENKSFVCLSFTQNFGEEKEILNIEIKSSPSIYISEVVFYSRIQ